MCAYEAGPIRKAIAEYVQGKGVDIGCGMEKICSNAIGLDHEFEYNNYKKPRTAADVFGPWEPYIRRTEDDSLDFVFSSHLLEDYDRADRALLEWVRVVKPNGYVVLFLPRDKAYVQWCLMHGATPNTNHAQKWNTWEDFLAWLPPQVYTKVGVKGLDVEPYSFLIVMQKGYPAEW